MSKHELLSPAGSMEALRAAVQNGADAVYFGAGDFNARRNAENFGGTLNEAVAYCHIHGARSFITLNTMVREDEFPRLTQTIESIAESGADGVIVQDLGVASAVKSIVPTIELHASTQMAVHNTAGVEFLLKKGFDRVVLAREMTVSEIRECAKTGAELEVFVHGALCVSCSGQCLLSSMIGGRSGNRGLCAQPCRMNYRADGASGYLLSTRDLCGLNSLAELSEAGVYSFKLEGRLKRPEYVGLTTRVYREAIDSINSGIAFDIEKRSLELKQMFNRGGFTDGYFHNMNESQLMYTERPNNIGVRVGSCDRDGHVHANVPIDKADTICLRRGDRDIPIRAEFFQGSDAAIREARRGDALIRLVSRAQITDEHERVEADARRSEIDIRCELRENAPACLTLTCASDTVSVTGDVVQTARSGHTDRDRIIVQLEKTGDTAYIPRHTELIADPSVFLPVSAINAMRRDACAKLDELRRGNAHDVLGYQPVTIAPSKPRTPVIIARSSDPMVLAEAISAGADEVAWRPNDLRIEALDRALRSLPERFELTLPPVMTQQSISALNRWALKHSERVIRTRVSNIGQFDFTWPGDLAGDAQLNIANNAAVHTAAQWGLTEYTPSIELNCSQIAALGGSRSLIVYGRLPLMELRHCPYRNVHHIQGAHAGCSRCDKAAAGDRLIDMKLTDRTGAAFTLSRTAADTGCVIELCNSAKLMLLRKWSSLPPCDSIQILLESDDPVEAIIALHREAIRGSDPRDSARFAQIETMNTTTGHYFRGVL